MRSQESCFSLLGHDGRPRHHHSSPYGQCDGSWRLRPLRRGRTRPGTLRAPREADLGPGGVILVESELPEAEIRFYGSTNARPTTPRDGCDGVKANFHAARTIYDLPPDPLSNFGIIIT